MFKWYVVNTYSGHENKVKANLEHRIESMGQRPRFRRVVVPTEQVIETKDGQKVQTEKRVLPGYVLVNMDLNDDAWMVVKNTPGVTGFVGAGSKPVPLGQGEVDRILKTGASTGDRPRAQVEFSLGESVKVTSGPLSDFDGEIVDVNAPPVGPALGQHGVNIMEFCKAFNAQTAQENGRITPVEITVYEDRSFDFITKTPPAAVLIKEALRIEKGSAEPNRNKVGKLTRDQVRSIAETKLVDLNARDVEQAMKVIAGTARSMGVEVEA